MRGRFVIVLGLAILAPSIALGADPLVGAPAAERAETTAPAVVPPAPVVNEKPKPVEKPRPTVETVRPQAVAPGKPVETPAPFAVPAPAPADNGMTMQGQARAGYSVGCLGLAFAMLVTGIAAGFLWRHLMSRHKLGGMSVRIGTWRGIP